jgi:hypothetical protein
MADMTAHAGVTRTRRMEQAITFEMVCDMIVYWVALIGVYLMIGWVMIQGAIEKLFRGPIEMPAATAKSFETTWLATFPGLNFLWGVLGVLELAITLVLLASIVSGEFLPSRQKSLLQVSLVLSLLLFSFLAFGQVTTSNFAGLLGQFTYFGVAILMMGLVAMLPPNRPTRWLTTEYFRTHHDDTGGHPQQ